MKQYLKPVLLDALVPSAPGGSNPLEPDDDTTYTGGATGMGGEPFPDDDGEGGGGGGGGGEDFPD